MKGRKKKPTALKLLAGNPGKRKLTKEFTLASFSLDVPEELLTNKNKIAKEEWERNAPLLVSARILKKIDRTAMLVYCLAFQDFIQASRGLEKGYFIKNERGELQISPYVKLQKNFFEQITKMCSELGLTPTSRCKLETHDETSQHKDKLESELFG